MSTILITGAYGFVGTNLSAHLAQRGHTLWALDLPEARREATAYARDFHWAALDAIPWPAVDAVIHLAGKAHDTKNASDPQSYFDINAGLTQRVIGQLQPHTARRKKFILFSSVKACADTVDGMLTEDAPPNPQTPYGQSKLQAEAIATAATSPALQTYILRPCMIHGPGNKGNLNLLYAIASKGIPWPLGAFDNKRTFAAIGNVSAVTAGLIENDIAPGIYQVADDEPLSTNRIIRLIAESAGKQARIWRTPPSLIRPLAKLGDTLRLPLNSERLKKLTESYIASNKKIRHALQWERMPVTAEDGMRKTLASFTCHH